MIKKIFLIALLLFILIKARVPNLLSGNTPMMDFDNYYHSVIEILAGKNPYQLKYMQVAGPPAVLIPYLGYALLNLNEARILITTQSLLAGIIGCWILSKKIFFKNKFIDQVDLFLILNIVLWLSFPARFTLGLGQPNLILMVAVTYLLTGKNKNLISQFLSLMVLIKTNFVITVLSYFKDKKKIVVQSAIGILFLVILAIPVLNMEYYSHYFLNRASKYIVLTQDQSDLDYYNQSLRSTLTRIGLTNYTPAIYIFVALAGVIYVWRTATPSTGILMSLVISPITWQHYLVIIFPVFVLLLSRLLKANKNGWAIMLTFFWLLTAVEFPALHLANSNLINGLIASHFFIGLVGISVINNYNREL